jgi:segregation and condensation protein B
VSEEASSEVGPPGPERLRAALEAIMLVVDEPVSEAALAAALGEPVDTVAATLADLAEEYTAEGRGFELRRAAGGWRLYTRPELAPYVERFVLDGQQARLSQAALETLAVIAYRQPVSRSRISAIRGVNCDAVLRTLLTRGLVAEAGTDPETGAHLYRTTPLFLEKLGLESLDQLPPLAPFLPEDVDDLDPDARPEREPDPQARPGRDVDLDAHREEALDEEARAVRNVDVDARPEPGFDPQARPAPAVDLDAHRDEALDADARPEREPADAG